MVSWEMLVATACRWKQKSLARVDLSLFLIAPHCSLTDANWQILLSLTMSHDTYGSSSAPPSPSTPPLPSNPPKTILKPYQEFVFTQEQTVFVFTGKERFCVYFKECPVSDLRFPTLVRSHKHKYISVSSGPWRLSHCLCTDCIVGQCS